MSQRKHTPDRRCIACGAVRPKQELLRIVRTPEGEIKADMSGRVNGRGAYLCKDIECLKKAARKKLFDRALKTTAAPEVYENLEEVFSGFGKG